MFIAALLIIARTWKQPRGPSTDEWIKKLRYIYMMDYYAQLFSHVTLFPTPRTVAHKAPLSMGFSRHEYWSGLPFASPGSLPDPGTKPEPTVLAGRLFTTEPPGKPTLPLTWFLKACP